ncbi:MAG: DUF362 domain-containing protein [Armatimonadetes bacterium]|nr:DUF362 domain-containing protein [Armatimonadota bacterium]
MLHSAHGTTGRLAALSLAVILTAAVAHAGGASCVCVARAEKILLPQSALAPSFAYPEGKLDYNVVAKLVDDAVMSLTGESGVREAWCGLFSPTDRVGIQLDVNPLPVHRTLLEAVTLRLIACGVPQSNIVIYSGEEVALFQAGFDLSETPGRIRVMGADAQGFRKGLSRIVLDHCTVIINLARLRVDPRVGMSGALTNCLSSVPYEERERLLRTPEELPAAAARASLKVKTRLHIVDALQPALATADNQLGFVTWLYRGVMVSRDPVALDAVGRRILLDRLREDNPDVEALSPPVVYLQPAHDRYHLGTADPDAIELREFGP